MADTIEVCIIRSNGKDCLSVGNNIVAGPWVGIGSTVKTFNVRVDDLERIIAEHKAREENGNGN